MIESEFRPIRDAKRTVFFKLLELDPVVEEQLLERLGIYTPSFKISPLLAQQMNQYMTTPPP